jgi:hypothetical protein
LPSQQHLYPVVLSRNTFCGEEEITDLDFQFRAKSSDGIRMPECLVNSPPIKFKRHKSRNGVGRSVGPPSSRFAPTRDQDLMLVM